MPYRYIHKIWKFFWRVIFGIFIFLLIGVGGAFVFLQLDSTEDIIAQKIERLVADNFKGQIIIGELDGNLPFSADFKQVQFIATVDSARVDTVVSIKKIEVGINLRKLLQKKLVINQLVLNEPRVQFLSDESGGYTLLNALQAGTPNDTTDSGGFFSGFIQKIEIVAPKLAISNGSLFIEKFYHDSDTATINWPEPLTMQSFDTKIFIELTSDRRFVDIEQFEAVIEGFQRRPLSLSGQVYNNDQVLEFNAFKLTIGNSELHLNGGVKGIDLYAGGIGEQFKQATFDVRFGSDRLILAAFDQMIQKLPKIKQPLQFELNIKGPLNTLELQTFKLGVGQSYFNIQGEVNDLFSAQELTYNFHIDTLNVYRNDIEELTSQSGVPLFEVLHNLNIAGYAQGSSDTLSLNIMAKSPLGRFSFMGQTQLIEPFHFIGRLTGKGVDMSPFLASNVDTTYLNFEAGIKGGNLSKTEGRLYFDGDIYNSLYGHIPIDTLSLMTTLDGGILKADYLYTYKDERIDGHISANFNPSQAQAALKGRMHSVNLSTFLAHAPVDSTSLNATYTVQLKGLNPNNISGKIHFKVRPSVVGTDSVAAHQLTATLSPDTMDVRTLTVNSSLFDLNITGDIQPKVISNLYTYWNDYFNRRITDEILLDTVEVAPSAPIDLKEPVKLTGKIDFKQLDIVKAYVPTFPAITTDGTVRFKAQAGDQQLQFSARIQSDTLIVSQTNLKNADVHIQGRFKHGKQLKQYSNFELKANVAHLQTDIFKMDSLQTRFRFHQDSLFLSQQIKQFSDTARYDFELYATLTDSTVTTVVQNLFLGNQQYGWQEGQQPTFIYTRAGEFIFDAFEFENKASHLVINGKIGGKTGNGLSLRLQNVDLARVSSLLREEITFGGKLNAKLVAQSLQKPKFKGTLQVDKLQIKDHYVGNIRLKSNYGTKNKRINLQLALESDSINYEGDFFSHTKGKDIFIQGFYNPNARKTASDSLFYFETDFNSLDTWFLAIILEDIFNDVRGVTTGEGYITHTNKGLDFHASMQLHDLSVEPVFINTEWTLNGQVELDSENGVVVNFVDIRGSQNGTGTLWGRINLNNFNPGTHIDLTLLLNKLRFLDNNYEPGVAFYGSVGGTGKVRLEGWTDEMRLYSVSDITITPNSTFVLPLLTETQVVEADQFIEFVESFESPQKALNDTRRKTNKPKTENALVDEQEDLSFTDRVDIDLQFRAPEPIKATMLFDPLTNEKISATGTGDMRIIMANGDVQLFGRFNVMGGTYNFVINQLFKRKIDIQSGGSIVWNGDPEEARINVEAIYNATPDVSPLLTQLNQDEFSRSIPINLVIEITGTLNSIQQNYYFELPEYTNTEPQLQYSLNRINSNEQAKLIQATSILLNGEFLPVAASGSMTQAFGKRLSQGQTYINPIISNQIVSPFLSDQINALLNSEVAEVDIDFELNAYNEINLGVALRLYNDRLILQRRGRLTSRPGSDEFLEKLGNISLAYRITPHLSVRAFHRQIPNLDVFSSAQAADFQPSVEGVGLQAEFGFNTWRQVWSDFIYLLGIGEKPSDEQSAQEQESPNKQQKTESKSS